MLEPITVSEFLKLPDRFQTLYVAGVLEGIAFMAYGYDPSQYPTWVQCVRQKSLGDTAEDVVTFIKERANFSEGIASAVAQSLGQRCKR